MNEPVDNAGMTPDGSDPIRPAIPDPATAQPRRWLRWLVGTSLALALSWAGIGFSLVRPDHMMVEHVEFRGNGRASDAALRHLVDVPNGTTIFGVDLVRAAKGARSHPWVKAARATREWPDTVVIEVDEHHPVALLADSQGLHYVDTDGSVFLQARGDDLDYPVLVGMSGETLDRHPSLSALAIHDALELIDALDVRDVIPREKISSIEFNTALGFEVDLRGSAGHAGARIIFGFRDRDREIDHLLALIERGVDLDSQILVDLGPADLAIVRPRSPGADKPALPAVPSEG